jgi:hypothetical protein
LVEASSHCATFHAGIEAQLSIVRPRLSSALVFTYMKTVKLKASPTDRIFDANECIRLSPANLVGKDAEWKVFVIDGCIWLSFVTQQGKHSTTPLIDVVLRAGQSYQLPTSDLRRGVIISTFEKAACVFVEACR